MASLLPRMRLNRPLLRLHASTAQSTQRLLQRSTVRWQSSTATYSASGNRLHRLLGLSGAALGLGLAMYGLNGASSSSSSSSQSQCDAKQRPQYSVADVAKHKTARDRIWVTYKDGVYDITEWVGKHPGGTEKIMLAAGGAIDPFWAIYQQHNSEQVRNILEEYRIGDLKPEDRKAAEATAAAANPSDPYANDPSDRHPSLIPRTVKPFNAEPPTDILVASYITPNDLHFKRNHLPVPTAVANAAAADPKSWKVVIGGPGIKRTELSFADLQKMFKKYSVTVTTQCAGNRRAELNPIKPVKGLEWGPAAIGTAVWTGVRLRDVLTYAGLKPSVASDPSATLKHVQFEGADSDPTTNTRYGASIPISKAIDERGDVILAFEMNGQKLPLDHGYPIRVVVPGTVGARHVKWLRSITVSNEESSAHWQQKDYKSFNPAVDWYNVDWKSAPAMQDMPVQSAICEPKPNSTIEVDNSSDDGGAAPSITVKGYAWSGGGRGIARVDVSVDGGQKWAVANLHADGTKQEYGRAWAWTPWTVQIPLPTKQQEAGSTVEIMCKAVDTSYNQQPDTLPPIYNLRGVGNNAWHRVKVNVAAPSN